VVVNDQMVSRSKILFDIIISYQWLGIGTPLDSFILAHCALALVYNLFVPNHSDSPYFPRYE